MKPKIITTIIDKDQHKKIRKLAFVRRISFAKTLRQIIDDYFKLKVKN